MIIKRPEVSYNTIAEQIKRGVNSLTIAEWNFIINSLRVQANVNADQIKYIHSVLFGLDDVSLNSDGVALIPELYDKIYNGVIDRAAADGNGNNIINTYATKTELADQIANAQIKIIEIDSLDDVEDPDEDVLYILDGEQYRAYKGTLIKITSLRPLEDMINVDNVIIDGGEYE